VWVALSNLEEFDFIDVPVLEELHALKQRTYYRRGDHSISTFNNTINEALYTPLPPPHSNPDHDEEEADSTTWLNDCFYS